MLNYNQKYIVFDTETEGLNLKYSRPWELSYVLAQGTKILDRRQIYIDIPNLDVSPFIRRLTGFTDEKFDAKKISPREALDEFSRFLYDDNYMLVGQNILKFDVWMLRILAELVGEKLDFSFMDRFMDTRFLAVADLNQIAKPRNGQYLNWFYKLHNDTSLKRRGVGQKALLKKFKIPFEEKKLHDGLYDVEKNWEIFLELKKRLKL